MKTEHIHLNHWDGILSADNIDPLRHEITRRLEGKKTVVIVDNPSRSDLEIYSGQTLTDKYVTIGSENCILMLLFEDRRLYFETRFNWTVIMQGSLIRFYRLDAGRIQRVYLVEQE